MDSLLSQGWRRAPSRAPWPDSLFKALTEMARASKRRKIAITEHLLVPGPGLPAVLSGYRHSYPPEGQPGPPRAPKGGFSLRKPVKQVFG